MQLDVETDPRPVFGASLSLRWRAVNRRREKHLIINPLATTCGISLKWGFTADGVSGRLTTVSTCIYVYRHLFVSVSTFIYLHRSLSICIYLQLFVYVPTFYLFVPVSTCICLYLFASVSTFIYLYLSVSSCICIYFYLYLLQMVRFANFFQRRMRD